MTLITGRGGYGKVGGGSQIFGSSKGGGYRFSVDVKGGVIDFSRDRKGLKSKSNGILMRQKSEKFWRFAPQNHQTFSIFLRFGRLVGHFKNIILI